MMIPAYVYFGNAAQQYANSGNTAANNNAVGQQQSYYGFISEWTAEYTHWTSNMVPIRAAVSITFTMLPEPARRHGAGDLERHAEAERVLRRRRAVRQGRHPGP